MNTMVRAIAREQLVIGLSINRIGILLPILFILVLMSALSVVYVKEVNRQLLGHMQHLYNEERQLDIERNRLLLEQSALTTRARVQGIAQQGLTMILPPAAVVEMVEP